jgi:hypothetical protein
MLIKPSTLSFSRSAFRYRVYHLYLLAYEYGTDRGYRNVGMEISDAGESLVRHSEQGENLKSRSDISLPFCDMYISYSIFWKPA